MWGEGGGYMPCSENLRGGYCFAAFSSKIETLSDASQCSVSVKTYGEPSDMFAFKAQLWELQTVG